MNNHKLNLETCSFCRLFTMSYPKTIAEPITEEQKRDFRTFWIHLYKTHNIKPQPVNYSFINYNNPTEPNR